MIQSKLERFKPKVQKWSTHFSLVLGCWLLWLLAPQLFLQYPGLTGGLAFLALNVHLLVQSRNVLSTIRLLPVLATLMLWVMPAFQYQLEAWHGAFDGMRMQVDAGTYFGVAIPGVLAIVLACFVPLSGTYTDERGILQRAIAGIEHRRWILPGLSVLGGLALWVGPLVPAGLNFPVYLLRCCLYVVAILLTLLPRLPQRGWWLTLLALVLLTDALRTAMFGEMLTTALIALLFAAFWYRWPVWKMLIGQVVLFVALCWLISFKYHYRKAVFSTQSTPERVALLGQLAWQSTVDVDGFQQRLDGVVARLSQGANTSRILYYVPQFQPFVNGSTIQTAVLSAAVPRFLWPDKPTAGGADNIHRFMGIENLPYSINLGVVGESYVNFGRRPAFVWFLMVYVLLFRVLYAAWMRQSRRWPELLLLSPIVFFVVNTVEMDVNIVLNHVVKSGVLLFGLVWIGRTTFQISN